MITKGKVVASWWIGINHTNFVISPYMYMKFIPWWLLGRGCGSFALTGTIAKHLEAEDDYVEVPILLEKWQILHPQCTNN